MYNGERPPNEGWSSEDCLYLNVYTGSLDAAEARPVIVWFHTGGFNFGWSGGPLYDGSNLARSGAVVVTVNYRLGRLGFLAHPALTAESAHHASGNYGLLDQIAALEWVRDNIAAFGGNPSCVTIYGQSAGSSSVSVMMASPLAAGLFHRAIGSSAGSFGPTSEKGTHFGSCFQSLAAAERCGAAYMSGRGVSTAAEMRALPATSLLDVDYHGQTPAFLETVYPIIDGYVLPANSYDLFTHKRHNDVPLLTGSNAGEGQGIHFSVDADLFARNNRDLLGTEFENLKKVYPMTTEQQTMISSGNAGADRVFSWQNWTWARLQAKYSRSPVYYYHFAYEPPIPPNRYAEQATSPNLGAAHSIEVPYVWRNLQSRDWPFSEVDYRLSDTLSSYWLNFARTGDPNGAGLVQWPQFRAADPKMMRFDAQPTVQQAPAEALRSRLAYWDRVFEKQL
jgi:para-nitrobenzyl esterase